MVNRSIKAVEASRESVLKDLGSDLQILKKLVMNRLGTGTPTSGADGKAIRQCEWDEYV